MNNCKYCNREIYPTMDFCSDECRAEDEFNFSLDECIKFVSNESPASDADKMRNLAKRLKTIAKREKEPLARAWSIEKYWD